MAQVATIDQQREIMRYMRGLNEWLERDVHDRQSEILGVNARLDNLSDHINMMVRQPMGKNYNHCSINGNYSSQNYL